MGDSENTYFLNTRIENTEDALFRNKRMKDGENIQGFEDQAWWKTRKIQVS